MTDTLSQHIATLLRRNDCVIVPGLGAFIATRCSAVVSSSVMLPPRREITFNPIMTHDDGLLAESVSRRLQIPFSHAREKVAAEVALLHRRLHSEGTVLLPNVGMLNRRSGGRLEFITQTPWLILPQINVAKAAPTLEITQSSSEDKAVAVVRVPIKLRWLRIAAAIAIVSILGFALSTPIDIDTAHNASLAAPAFTPPESSVVEPLPVPIDMCLNLATAPADGIVNAEKPEEPVYQPYIIVIGSLPSRAKAEQFIGEVGLDCLKIYNGGGNYRVFAAEGATPEAARDAAEKIAGFNTRFPDAWVCKR